MTEHDPINGGCCKHHDDAVRKYQEAEAAQYELDRALLIASAEMLPTYNRKSACPKCGSADRGSEVARATLTSDARFPADHRRPEDRTPSTHALQTAWLMGIKYGGTVEVMLRRCPTCRHRSLELPLDWNTDKEENR